MGTDSAYWLKGFESRFCAGHDGENAEQTVLFYERLLRPIIRRPVGRILDAGCGPGRVLLATARLSPGSEMVGIDGSRRILALARENLADHSANAVLRQVDLTAPGFHAPLLARFGHFDLITCFFVIHHYAPQQVATILRGFRKLLSPDAKIVLAECINPRDSRAQWTEWISGSLAGLAGTPADLLLAPEVLRGACRKAGFAPADIRLVPRRGQPFSPAERTANRAALEELWTEVAACVREYQKRREAMPSGLRRLVDIVRRMRRHQIGNIARVGPLLFVLQSRSSKRKPYVVDE